MTVSIHDPVRAFVREPSLGGTKTLVCAAYAGHRLYSTAGSRIDRLDETGLADGDMNKPPD